MGISIRQSPDREAYVLFQQNAHTRRNPEKVHSPHLQIDGLQKETYSQIAGDWSQHAQTQVEWRLHAPGESQASKCRLRLRDDDVAHRGQ